MGAKVLRHCHFRVSNPQQHERSLHLYARDHVGETTRQLVPAYQRGALYN